MVEKSGKRSVKAGGVSCTQGQKTFPAQEFRFWLPSVNAAAAQKANLACCKHPVLRTLPGSALLAGQDNGGSSGSKESSNSSNQLPHGSKSSTSPSQPQVKPVYCLGSLSVCPAQKGEQSVGLCNIRCIKMQNKTGKGQGELGGEEISRGCCVLGCLLCFQPVGAGVIQAGCWSGCHIHIL